MAYDGETMTMCPSVPFNFDSTYAVVVSGDGPNFCGHLLLNVGGVGGTYFHVAGFRKQPKYMSEDGYGNYVRENKKKELTRFKVKISNPASAMLKLEELLSKKWQWGVLPHNCASFVEEVVAAGGSSAGLYSNCPAKESFD